MLHDIHDLAIDYLPKGKYIKDNYERLRSSNRPLAERSWASFPNIQIVADSLEDYVAYMKLDIEKNISENVFYFTTDIGFKYSDRNRRRVLPTNHNILSSLLTDNVSITCISALAPVLLSVNIYYLVRHPGRSKWLKHISSLYFKHLQKVVNIPRPLCAHLFLQKETIVGSKMYKRYYGVELFKLWKHIIRIVECRIYPLRISYKILDDTITYWKPCFDSDVWECLT